MSKLSFHFFPKQMKELFVLLDHDKNNIIDLSDWRKSFPTQIVSGSLQQIKDVIFRNQLRQEDVLLRLKLKANQTEIGLSQLAKGIENMDFTMNYELGLRIANEILQGKESIKISELCDILECIEDEITNEEWLNKTYRKIHKTLKERNEIGRLHRMFKYCDLTNLGSIAKDNFKNILMLLLSSGLNLTYQDA